MNGNDCTPSSGSQMPGDDCVFIVNGPSGIESSVMGVPYLAGNDQWCDDTEQRYHHDDIPTKHNTMCNGQSVFSVVKQSPDFKGYTPMLDEIDTTPNFTILQPSGDKTQAFVFILDYSGSMDDNRRGERMKQGVKRFMEIDVDQSQQLPFGVVSFSGPKASETKIAQEIIPIKDDTSRDKIIKVVEEGDGDGGTCLHLGVSKGLEALRHYNMTKGGAAIFLTDGEQNCKPTNEWLDAVINNVLAQDVRFCTIAFSNSADEKLEELARQTNGAAFFVPDNSGPEYINNAMVKCLDFLPSQPTAEKEVTLFQKTYDSRTSQVAESIVVDQYSGRNTNIQIDYDVTGIFNVITEFNNNSPVSINGEGSVKINAFADAIPADLYKLIIDPNGGAKINFLTVLIKTKAPTETQPLTTNCWTNVGQNKVDVSLGDKLVVYGQATQGKEYFLQYCHLAHLAHLLIEIQV